MLHPLREAKAKVRDRSRVVETTAGPIEVAELGEGDPVLVVHGAGGGFDQGIFLARTSLGLDPTRWHVVAPSRFGYLRTPLPPDGSSDAQAEAHVALLDALGLREPVPVVGVSAGALSVVPLAIRHPERVRALVLMVPATHRPRETVGGHPVAGSRFVVERVLKHDLPAWAFLRFAKHAAMSFVGVPRALQDDLTDAERREVDELLGGILPVSERYEGILNDDRAARGAPRLALDRVRAPTLVIDAADVDTYEGSKRLAAGIPGARFLEFATGGHLLLGHGEAVRAAVRDFLASV